MTEIITAKHASESQHWYRPDGTPAYTYINKKGEEKPTTLRQARAEGLVPSVTSIIRLAAAPGLENWKQEQVILACLTMPKIANETETAYIARIKKDAQEQASQAAARGTLIHAYVQSGFEGLYCDDEPGTAPSRVYYESAQYILDIECGGMVPWITEKSFARDGYGGKVDLHCIDRPAIVVDIKTTEKDIDTIKTWDEHAMQLAAYRHGLNMDTARCAILYINVHTARGKLLQIEEKELQAGFKCFMALLAYWKAKNQIEEG